MRSVYFAFLISIILFGNTSLFSQEENPALLTIDRLFHNHEFYPKRLPATQWFNNGDAYTILLRSEEYKGASDIEMTDIESGKSEIIIKAEQLIPEGQDEPLSISAYSWSDDQEYLMIFTNTKRVWRTNTRGDYWVFNRKDGSLKQLGKSLPESSLMFAKFSPDNRFAAYVSKFNIYKEELLTGAITQLTYDGTEDIINGTFDWAYEEELSCKDGFLWSPDGKQIAFWQIDATDIKDFYMINYTDSIYSQPIPIQYPKVGQDPSSAKIGVVNLQDKKITWLKIPGDQKQHYLPRMQWINDKILVRQLNRKQNELRIFICNSHNGDSQEIYSEKDAAWVAVINSDLTARRAVFELYTLDDNSSFLTETEKDGWRHIYRISMDGKKETNLTKGDYDIGVLYGINAKAGLVYVSASPENATQRYLYSVNLDGSGNFKRLTPEEYSGINTYKVSPNGLYAFHTHSNINTPTNIHLIRMKNHELIKTLIDNAAYKEKVSKLDLPKTEFFKITTADGVEMDGSIMKPLGFDSSKKYPVLFHVYGEPWSVTVTDNWSLDWHTMLAQMGYIIINVDNRGTPSLKGREWRKCIYRKIGIINSDDQAAAAREILKWKFIDPERIAIWGWSGGGTMTLNQMFRYPEIYKTGISVAPVSNQLYYDNIYQERYMGLPSENMQDFIDGSPITHAKNLQGNLLLVHGTGDDNVHYQNTEAVINNLIENNKQFQVMPYPNRSHGIYEGKNTRRHLYTMITNYLVEHCPPGAK